MLLATAKQAPTPPPLFPPPTPLRSGGTLAVAMYSTRRLLPRLSSISSTTPSTAATSSAARSFASCAPAWSKASKAPALSDIEPEQGHVFDGKQKQFREQLAEQHRKRKEQERQSATSAAKSSDPSSFAATSQVLGEAAGSLTPHTGKDAQKQEDPNNKKKGGRLISIIYGGKSIVSTKYDSYCDNRSNSQ